jgi:hypothetical protein
MNKFSLKSATHCRSWLIRYDKGRIHIWVCPVFGNSAVLVRCEFKTRISSHLRSFTTCLINILPNQILSRFESRYSAEEKDWYIWTFQRFTFTLHEIGDLLPILSTFFLSLTNLDCQPTLDCGQRQSNAATSLSRMPCSVI